MRASKVMYGFVAVFCAAGALFAGGPSEDAGIAKRIEIQQARLGEIEAMAAQEREQTERWYDQRRAELTRGLSRKAAATISYPSQVRWVEFMKMHRGLPYPEAYFDASDYGFVVGNATKFAHLRAEMDREYFLAEMAHLLVSSEFEVKLTQLAYERLETPLLPVLREEARKLLPFVTRVRRELTMELRQLEGRRAAKLEAALEWESELKEQVRDILAYLRESESKGAEFGVVESIGYSPRTGYFCMVQGVDRVLGTGDTIGKVRVLSIDPEKVEFAKDGATWAQPLGAPAQPYWQ